MTISLTKPTEGSVGWASAVNTNFTDIENAINAGATGLPKGYVTGLNLKYVSASQVKVTAGKCRDSGDATDITLSSDQTADITTNAHIGASTAAAVNGLDVVRSAATISTIVGGDNKKASLSASILTELKIRSLGAITFTTSGIYLTASASVIGTVAVGDLVGSDSTGGFAWVNEIDSAGTTIKLYGALKGGDVGASTTLKLIENPTVEAANSGNDQRRIMFIDAAGTNIWTDGDWGSSSSGVTCYLGSEAAYAFYTVWVISDGSTPRAFLSTQRTTFLNPPSGYTTKRRVGWILNRVSSASDIAQFAQTGTNVRQTHVPFDASGATRILSAGSSTSYVDLNPGGFVPSTTQRIALMSFCGGAVSGVGVYFLLKPRGFTYGHLVEYVYGNNDAVLNWVPCDDCCMISYAASNGSNTWYIDVAGFEETI